MGLRASKQDKATKQLNDSIKQVEIASKKSKLTKLKQQLLTWIEKKNQNNGLLKDDSNQLVNISNISNISHPEASLFIIETAMKQLDRSGKTLIKADLIATIIALRPSYISILDELQKRMTVEDLNCLIRTIIYDPDTIISQNSPNEVVTHSKNMGEIDIIF